MTLLTLKRHVTWVLHDANDPRALVPPAPPACRAGFFGAGPGLPETTSVKKDEPERMFNWLYIYIYNVYIYIYTLFIFV